MAAYVISEVEMLDESQGQRYRELASASIAQYGGRYIVRGAEPEVPEGSWPASQRVVIVEFPTMQDLQRWYRSVEYAQALAIRRTALNRRLLFVEGVGGQPPEPIPPPPSVEQLTRALNAVAHLISGIGTNNGRPRPPAPNGPCARWSTT